jgi:hypothetical protein
MTTVYHKKAKSMGEPNPKWTKMTYAQLEINEISAVIVQVGPCALFFVAEWVGNAFVYRFSHVVVSAGSWGWDWS